MIYKGARLQSYVIVAFSWTMRHDKFHEVLVTRLGRVRPPPMKSLTKYWPQGDWGPRGRRAKNGSLGPGRPRWRLWAVSQDVSVRYQCVISALSMRYSVRYSVRYPTFIGDSITEAIRAWRKDNSLLVSSQRITY